MRFTGQDSEIDLESHGQIEFDAWRWADLDQALETVVAFKQDAYRARSRLCAPTAEHQIVGAARQSL